MSTSSSSTLGIETLFLNGSTTRRDEPMGWPTDLRFMTGGGLPLDLPMERNKQRRSFEDLVDKYAPGNHPGSVLKELRRRGNVEILDDEIIRFKSTTTRASGLTKANVAQAAS